MDIGNEHVICNEHTLEQLGTAVRLRKWSSRGMMDCVKTLDESGWDYEKAREYILRNGSFKLD